MSKSPWTYNKPTLPGLYWYRGVGPAVNYPFIIEVRFVVHEGVSGLFATDHGMSPVNLVKLSGEWQLTPIAPLPENPVPESTLPTSELNEILGKARKYDELTMKGNVDLELLIKKAKKYDELVIDSQKRAKEFLDSLVLG